MNLLALLLGLAIERVLTNLFHLREFRWLDPLFDAHFARVRSMSLPAAIALCAGLALVLALPVVAGAVLLWDEFLQIPYFLFAVVVLLFSLGPRDLDEEVEDYCVALETGDAEAQRRVAKELLEREPADAAVGRNAAVEQAIYVQANNRVFGVVFWFLVAGPAGAWLFRLLDLMRRRAQYQAIRPGAEAEYGVVLAAVRNLHAVFAWIPARLLALGYLLAGNFEEAVGGWRAGRVSGMAFADAAHEIIARVGTAASGRAGLDVTDSVEALDRIRGARALVMRTLWMIWCPIIAVMTLYDWLT